MYLSLASSSEEMDVFIGNFYWKLRYKATT